MHENVSKLLAHVGRIVKIYRLKQLGALLGKMPTDRLVSLNLVPWASGLGIAQALDNIEKFVYRIHFI